MPKHCIVSVFTYFRDMYKVPFLSLARPHRAIEAELKKSFEKILHRGKFILGSEVDAFEKEFAAYHQTKYCVSTGNGHDALLISLKSLGIGRGDQVIVPSHTCQATWLAVVNAGAIPVAVEVDPVTFNIDPLQIEKAISTKTKAVVPVHLYGHPCAMDKIMAVARRNNLFVVEDNAQSHGALFKNKMTGTWGHCNATSFYPTKNMGALGDGGAILINSQKLYRFARAFRNYGSDKKDIHFIPGINSRLDELQAAFLRIKLQQLDGYNEQRRKNARLYFKLLQNAGDIQLPPQESKSEKPVFHLFVIKTSYRNKLKNYLAKKRIETAVHYPVPVHLQKAFGSLGYKKDDLPIAEKLSSTVLSLPIWPGLAKKEIEVICAHVQKFFK